MDMLIAHLRDADPTPAAVPDLGAWLGRVQARDVADALTEGFAADRLGYAFVAGYLAATRALFGEPGALCATEAGGGHPRAIQATLTREREGWRLDGHKTFVTLGAQAPRLFVVARTERGEVDGRPELVVARVGPDTPGVRMKPGPATPFVPEIPHATVAFDGAPVEALPGDGYADFLKPFRTIEDLHVHAALVGHAIALTRRGGGDPAPLLALVPTLLALAAADPKAPATHLTLDAALRAGRAGLEGVPWANLDADTQARWRRDRPLLDVARRAREARLARAQAAAAHRG
ncbi:MAG: acyl-CoA dehydrogenase family protein [bacterium]